MSTWPADKDLAGRFCHPANAAVLAFLQQEHPWSAHDDLAEELFVAAQQIPEAESYCPDLARYAYVALHTKARVIFALAVGMNRLSIRLSEHGQTALSDGAMPSRNLGPEWYAFPVFTGDVSANRARIGRWLKVAYDLACRHESIR